MRAEEATTVPDASPPALSKGSAVVASFVILSLIAGGLLAYLIFMVFGPQPEADEELHGGGPWVLLMLVGPFLIAGLLVNGGFAINLIVRRKKIDGEVWYPRETVRKSAVALILCALPLTSGIGGVGWGLLSPVLLAIIVLGVAVPALFMNRAR